MRSHISNAIIGLYAVTTRSPRIGSSSRSRTGETARSCAGLSTDFGSFFLTFVTIRWHHYRIFAVIEHACLQGVNTKNHIWALLHHVFCGIKRRCEALGHMQLCAFWVSKAREA